MEPGKKRVLWVSVGVLAILALAYPKIEENFRKTDSASGSPSQAPAGAGAGKAAKGAGGPKVQVSAHVMRSEKIEEKITATGTVLAGEEVQLKSEAAGRIVSLPLKEGSRVRKGQLLVKINDADLQAQLIRATANYTISSSKANRQKQLLAKEAISQEDFEDAAQTLEAARGDMQLLKAQIEKTEIRAPFDGVVGLRYVSEGGYLSPGTVVANFISDHPLKIEFAIPEQYFSAVTPGRPVTFTVQGSGRKYGAKIYAVEPKVDESTRTVNVRALCDNGDGSIAPGSFAKVEFQLKEKPDALMAPSQALVPDAKGEKLYVLRGGAPTPQPVRTGLRREADVEILEGVSLGDTIITSGVMLLKPGAAVDVKAVN